MSDTHLTPDLYFDLTDVEFCDIFDNCTRVWDPIRKLDDYIAAQFETGKIRANYKDSTDIYVGDGTVIEDNVLINGPAIIGKNCTIRHGAYFRLGVLIGNEALIGHCSEIKHAIVMNNVTVPHMSVVSDSILGNKVNIAGGAITANQRLDRGPVKITHGDKNIETGLLKLGAVVGDNSNIGVNSVLNPGTILGKNTVVYPLTSVKGIHGPGSIIR